MVMNSPYGAQHGRRATRSKTECSVSQSRQEQLGWGVARAIRPRRPRCTQGPQRRGVGPPCPLQTLYICFPGLQAQSTTIRWLLTTQVSCLIVLEARSPKSRCLQSQAPTETCRGESFLASF